MNILSAIIIVFYLIYCFVESEKKIEFLSEHQIIVGDILLQQRNVYQVALDNQRKVIGKNKYC